MTVELKRITNPHRYLYALHPGDKFYIAAPLEAEDYLQLECYGIQAGTPARIPIPYRSPTRANANGQWRILRNLPKEIRSYQQAYHVIDWFGEHHYGTCWHHRMCYQRELIPPTSLAFIIEDGILYSPLLINRDQDLANIKAAMNVMLEMLGRFEIWTAERVPALPPVKQVEVPWEILRAGTRDQTQWETYIEQITRSKTKGQQTIIRDRHEHLWHMTPDLCVLGTQNFWGYVVYEFKHDLFVFESNEINNATYVFRGNWELASQLTKTEVLSSHIQEARIYHTEKWYESMSKLIAHTGKDVA